MFVFDRWRSFSRAHVLRVRGGITASQIALLIALIWPSTGLAATRQLATADVRRAPAPVDDSHVSANVPPGAAFTALLRRDVRAYLNANRLLSKNLEIELLRTVPTQSGVSYPKYYIWVRTSDGAGHSLGGAMRVAAVDRVRFEITNFTPAAAIRSDPTVIDPVYPAVLIPLILQRATAK